MKYSGPNWTRRAALAQAGAAGRDDARIAEDLGCDGLVGAPAVDGAGKQPRLRPHPPVVHAQPRERRGAERYVPIAASLAALDVNQHAPTADVRHLQMAKLGVPHPGRVQDHQHRAMRQTVGAVDHPSHLLDAQDLRQPTRDFRIRRAVDQVPTPDVDLRKRLLCAQRADWHGQVSTPKGARLRYVSMTTRIPETVSAPARTDALCEPVTRSTRHCRRALSTPLRSLGRRSPAVASGDSRWPG